MSELIKISNTEIQVKEYQGKRVCTFKDIDAVHQRPLETAGRNFRSNKKHFIEGEDYFRRNSSEAKTEYGLVAPNGLILITESGYLMLVKSFTDDLAWEVQRQLVNNYFRKPAPAPVPKQKSRREILEEKYIDALKAADQCKDVKEYHYGEYTKHERQYRKFLSHENECKQMAEHFKAEIKNIDNQKFLDMCKEASERFPCTI